MLERVRYEDPYRGIGATAYTDGYAYDEHSLIYLLSAAGRESSVKAVTAALTSGYEIELLSDRIVTVTRPYGEAYRVLSAKLPSGFIHQVVLSERFLDGEAEGEKLIYVPDGHDVAHAVYDAVRHAYAVPLLPEWAEWLRRRTAEADMLSELFGNCTVLRLSADEELLDELVLEGVRNGEIVF